MTQDWYWVRHGPTHERHMTGWRDVGVDLSDHATIAHLDAMLPMDAHVVSSDLRRAVDTATAIGGTRRRLPHEFGLREFDFGDWDGKPFDEIAKTHPQLSRQFWERPGDICAPGGESWNMVSNRAQQVIDRLYGTVPAIIAVAHMGLILTQVQRATGQTPYQTLAQRIDNFSVTHIQVRAQDAVLKSVNVTFGS